MAMPDRYAETLDYDRLAFEKLKYDAEHVFHRIIEVSPSVGGQNALWVARFSSGHPQ